MIGLIKNIIRRFTTASFRRSLGLFATSLNARSLKIPLIGKSVWRSKVKALEEIPTQVSIELTSICNAKCIMCPRHNMDRKKEELPMKLLSRELSCIKIKSMNREPRR